MTHTTAKSFWITYYKLPQTVQKVADKQFELLVANSKHPSLKFKRLKNSLLWSARVTQDYRAVAVPVEDGFQWLWIGAHTEYEHIIKRFRS